MNSNTNNPHRRNRTQFVIGHVIVICWAIAFLAPFILFLIPMCTPNTFLYCTFVFALAIVIALMTPITVNMSGRLHDTGIPGYDIFKIFIPFSGIFTRLWSKGDQEANEFGPPSQYKIPSIFYFLKILFIQGLVFSIGTTICFCLPPYIVLTSPLPMELEHGATLDEVQDAYKKVRQAKKKRGVCLLTTKELNALINANESLAEKIHVHSMNASAATTDKIEFEVDVNCRLDFVLERYLTARLKLEVMRKTTPKMRFYLKEMIGKEGKESPPWLNNQDITKYVYKYSSELRQLQKILNQLDIDYDLSSKRLKVTF
ncbi:DUF805 domain-containing protein [Candidatus Uabimicrobium amorphum]|uniref:DUF805 domain-containing protein n=1 Tax=Uabimicrobium amorphum TaxID=2596890 RepID=A0A5S9IPJ8_UABAM|nr:DUF805 domain-containing protein [Candidatus Uabimicrobium amorphum]BBM85256.1 hypothetical protein UABAM_03619 [Candidatus Uabimicrobium amorphum]